MKSKDVNHKGAKNTKKKGKPKERVTPPPQINKFYFDERSFEATLVDLSERVFRYFQNVYGQDSIYAYGLCGYAEFEELYPFVMTERMLDEYVAHMPDWSPEAKGVSSQDLRLVYRYSSGVFHDQRFEENDDLQSLVDITSKIGAQFRGMIDSARPILSEDELNQLSSMHKTNYTQACLNALQALDRKGLFGEGASREQVTIFLWYTDYYRDNSHINHVALLNPPAVFERYQTEMAHAECFNPYRQNK